jgi:anti-sigma regulatory factor (Ser/Thr protein kinase)
MGTTPESAPFEACFPASTSGLGIALKDVESFCNARALPADLVSRVLVIVEELFTNTQKYGYGGESEKPVRLRLVSGSVLTLVYEDEAGPFDPTTYKPAQHATPEEGPEGQTGIALALGLVASAHYVRLPNGNRVTLNL